MSSHVLQFTLNSEYRQLWKRAYLYQITSDFEGLSTLLVCRFLRSQYHVHSMTTQGIRVLYTNRFLKETILAEIWQQLGIQLSLHPACPTNGLNVSADEQCESKRVEEDETVASTFPFSLTNALRFYTYDLLLGSGSYITCHAAYEGGPYQLLQTLDGTGPAGIGVVLSVQHCILETESSGILYFQLNSFKTLGADLLLPPASQDSFIPQEAVFVPEGRNVLVVSLTTISQSQVPLTTDNERARTLGFQTYLPSTLKKFLSYWRLVSGHTLQRDTQEVVMIQDGPHDRLVPKELVFRAMAEYPTLLSSVETNAVETLQNALKNDRRAFVNPTLRSLRHIQSAQSQIFQSRDDKTLTTSFVRASSLVQPKNSKITSRAPSVKPRNIIVSEALAKIHPNRNDDIPPVLQSHSSSKSKVSVGRPAINNDTCSKQDSIVKTPQQQSQPEKDISRISQNSSNDQATSKIGTNIDSDKFLCTSFVARDDKHSRVEVRSSRSEQCEITKANKNVEKRRSSSEEKKEEERRRRREDKAARKAAERDNLLGQHYSIVPPLDVGKSNPLSTKDVSDLNEKKGNTVHMDCIQYSHNAKSTAENTTEDVTKTQSSSNKQVRTESKKNLEASLSRNRQNDTVIEHHTKASHIEDTTINSSPNNPDIIVRKQRKHDEKNTSRRVDVTIPPEVLNGETSTPVRRSTSSSKSLVEKSPLVLEEPQVSLSCIPSEMDAETPPQESTVSEKENRRPSNNYSIMVSKPADNKDTRMDIAEPTLEQQKGKAKRKLSRQEATSADLLSKKPRVSKETTKTSAKPISTTIQPTKASITSEQAQHDDGMDDLFFDEMSPSSPAVVVQKPTKQRRK